MLDTRRERDGDADLFELQNNNVLNTGFTSIACCDSNLNLIDALSIKRELRIIPKLYPGNDSGRPGQRLYNSPSIAWYCVVLPHSWEIDRDERPALLLHGLCLNKSFIPQLGSRAQVQIEFSRQAGSQSVEVVEWSGGKRNYSNYLELKPFAF